MKKLHLFSLIIGIAIQFNSCKEDKAAITIKDPDAAPARIDYSYKMGINLNEQVDVTDYNDLADSKTKWVRCFIEVIDIYKAGSLNTEAKIIAFNALKDKGYKTVLSLKFDFKKHGFPAINSTDWNNYLNFLQPLLAKVMPDTDALVVGNEPFIEADQSTWNEPLYSFYKVSCERIQNYFALNSINKPIFLGAFDNLYLTDRQSNAGYTNLLAFAKATTYIAGVDLHIHHAAIEDMTAALNFVKARLRDDQRMQVTEFSLIKHWKSNNGVLISPAFVTAANASTTDKIPPPPLSVTKNYQYIDYALKNSRPVEEWNTFWKNSPYLENRKGYLYSAYNILQNTGNVYLTFYALRQSYPLNTDFTETTEPWVLNGLLMNRSVELLHVRSQKSHSFLDQFIKITTEQNPCL